MGISAKYTGFDIGLAAQYQGAINLDPFWGLPQFTCRIATYGCERIVQDDRIYFDTNIEIHINPDTWIHNTLDQGFLKLADPDNPVVGKPGDAAYRPIPLSKKRRQVDADGIGPPHMVNLDGHGNPLAEGAAPVFLDFHIRNELPFSILNLPELEITLQ